jgi:multicomponent K+:H+ antiporter subunit D
LPPLPGFIGKLMLLQASVSHSAAVAVWAVVLGVGLLTLVGLARAGSILFWSVRTDGRGQSAGASPPLLAATLALLGMSVLMSVFAAPIQRYTTAAALQLQDRAAYARAMLPEMGGAKAQTTRPYRLEPAFKPAQPVPPDQPGGVK